MKNGGQSILEVVIALAIFALIAASFISLTLGSFIALDTSSNQLTATLIADDGLEAARATRDNAWNELVDGETSAPVGAFTRATTIMPVDLYQKNIKSQVDWTTDLGGASNITREARLTNWDSRDWIQTDWADGPGTAYANADPSIDDSTVGELKLKEKPMVWSLHQDTGGQTWNDIWMFSPNDGLVVGAGGWTGRLNGGPPWLIGRVGTTNWNGIYCLATNDCYVPGASGRIGRWNGTSWSVPSGWDTGRQTWNDIWMFSPSSGFVVGNGGNVRRWNGISWNNVTSGTTQNLTAISCSSASNCYAMGSKGAIIKWNGSTWSLYPSSRSPQNLNSVYCLSSSDCWAVGAGGVILHLTGGGFETTGVLTSSIFNMTDASPAQIIEWDEQIPVCAPASACNIKFQIRTGNATMSDASWPASPFNFTNAAGTIINPSYNGKQYAQYQVQLNGDGAQTPILNEVRINYK